MWLLSLPPIRNKKGIAERGSTIEVFASNLYSGAEIISTTTGQLGEFTFPTFSYLTDHINVKIGKMDRSIEWAKAKEFASNTATIDAGTSTIDVSHGMGKAPSTVIISPLQDCNPRRWWVSAKTALIFTISLDANAGSDLSFDWWASS